MNSFFSFNIFRPSTRDLQHRSIHLRQFIWDHCIWDHVHLSPFETTTCETCPFETTFTWDFFIWDLFFWDHIHLRPTIWDHIRLRPHSFETTFIWDHIHFITFILRHGKVNLFWFTVNRIFMICLPPLCGRPEVLQGEPSIEVLQGYALPCP